ncbi:glutamate racemase [Variovorax terrae]|uniref:Glutamate racemase n=1 Tax=Variovorax terrae TaxID=2923278 RepID=A0A9X1VT26_9BURK|nr:glutamate racemase [Variovorax terrae]MCJ0762865.1 glutamate racemase [Variovorax terrae]
MGDTSPLPGARRPVGVFDSGVGGLSILRALRAGLPREDFVYFSDGGHAPYGERGDAYVAARSQAITQELRAQHGIKALVVACNTATTAAVHLLRAEHPDLPIIGVEPALKPAIALSRTGRIGIMATRGTLASAKFRALHEALAGQAEFIVQPCDGLADAIQSADATKTIALCDQYTRTLGSFGSGNGQIDTLVLGCTHYTFASDVLRALVGPQVTLVDTGEPVARQTRQRLEAAGLLATDEAGGGQLRLLGTDRPGALEAAAARWLA